MFRRHVLQPIVTFKETLLDRSCFVDTFFILMILSDQLFYFSIYFTDSHQICRFGNTMTVDERAEVTQKDVAMTTNFVGHIKT